MTNTCQDPVNKFDLDGKCWSWATAACAVVSDVGHFVSEHKVVINTGLTIVSVIAGIGAFTPSSVICAGISAGASALNVGFDIANRDYVSAGLDGMTALSFGAGAYLKWSLRGASAAYGAKWGVKGMGGVRRALGRVLGRHQRRVARWERWDHRLFASGAGYAIAHWLKDRI